MNIVPPLYADSARICRFAVPVRIENVRAMQYGFCRLRGPEGDIPEVSQSYVFKLVRETPSAIELVSIVAETMTCALEVSW